jgi:hypothetical protein
LIYKIHFYRKAVRRAARPFQVSNDLRRWISVTKESLVLSDSVNPVMEAVQWAQTSCCYCWNCAGEFGADEER